MSSADADATLGTISGRRVSETQVRRGVAARVVRSDDRGADTRQKKEPRFFWSGSKTTTRQRTQI